jgi:hypothetical protein
MITNIPRNDMLMLDNFIYSFSLDIPSGIPIKPYYRGQDDYELEYLTEKLSQIKYESENTPLSEFVSRVLGLEEFYKYLETKEKKDPEDTYQITRRSVIVGEPSKKIDQSKNLSPMRPPYVPQMPGSPNYSYPVSPTRY